MKDLILGSHLFFAREGDVIDSVTVAHDAKPDVDPETNFTKLGCIEMFEPTKEGFTEIVRRCPSPGRYADRKILQTGGTLVFNFSVQQWDEMTLAEMLFNADKPQGGVFVPNSRREDVRGWFKIQAYDQNDQMIVAMDIWGSAKIDSYQFNEGADPYALQIRMLHSELNEGAITNL